MVAISLGTADITHLVPSIAGLTLGIRCPACGHGFSSYQATVAGCAVGEHACPACGATLAPTPETIAMAVLAWAGKHDLATMAALTEAATAVAEAWHRIEPLARLLRHAEVDLGPATERGLLSHVTTALVHMTAPSLPGDASADLTSAASGERASAAPEDGGA